MAKPLDPKVKNPPRPEGKDKLPRKTETPRFGDRFANLPPIGIDDDGVPFSEL